MIYALVLFRVKAEVDVERLEWMMSFTRLSLLKIREVLHLNVGKRIDAEDSWDWFLSIETENRDKLAMIYDDAAYYRFLKEVIDPYIVVHQSQIFEMDPRKNPKYS